MKKQRWFQTAVLIAALGLAGAASAVNPAADFKAPLETKSMFREAVVSAIQEQVQTQEQAREREVEQIREMLRLDELDRQNTMRQALREENLEDRIQGHADLELAMEQKNVDVHLGKSLIDMHGNRVRMEEYVFRPGPDQVQFLNLTLRDDRLDYIDYRAFFNQVVPARPIGGWRKEFGRHQPDLYLVRETIQYSNLEDKVAYAVDYFAPTWVSEIQQYVLPIQENTLSVNDILKMGYTRAEPDLDFTEMPGAVGLAELDVELIDRNLLSYRVRLTFNDETFLQLEKYLIDEEGNVLSWRWDTLDDYVYWLTHLSDLALLSFKEQIWTATEFEGRTIDTVSKWIRLVDVFANDDRGWR